MSSNPPTPILVILGGVVEAVGRSNVISLPYRFAVTIQVLYLLSAMVCRLSILIYRFAIYSYCVISA